MRSKRFSSGRKPGRLWLSFRSLLGFGVGYFIVAVLSHWASPEPYHFVAFWLPSGFYLAALASRPPNLWPAFILTALAVNIGVNLIAFGQPPAVGVAFAIGDTLEVLTGAWLLGRAVGIPLQLETVRDVVALTGLGALLSTTIGATAGTAAVALVYGEPFAAVWLTWWTGDMAGILVMVPLCITVRAHHRYWREISPARRIEALAALLSVVTLTFAVFTDRIPFTYVIMPPLLWMGVRFGIPGVSFAVLLLGVIAARYTALGQGAFAEPEFAVSDRALLVQSLVVIISLSGLVLGALANQWRQALAALREARDHLEKEVAERTATLSDTLRLQQAILDGANYYIVSVDPQGVIQTINKAAEKALGYGADEIIGKETPLIFHDPAELETHVEALAHTLGRRVSRNFEVLIALAEARGATEVEWSLIRKDGSRFPAHLSFSVMRDKNGAIAGYLGIAHDISVRKEAEKALQQSQRDLNRAQTVGRIGSWRLNVRRNELIWSDENHRIFGIPKGTPLTYQTFLDCVHPSDRKYVHWKWKAALRSAPYDIEHRIVVGDEIRWVREKAELEFDRGTLLGAFGTTQDITELKRAELALRRHSERQTELLAISRAALDDQTTDAELSRMVFEKVHALLDADVGLNYRVDENSRSLRLIASHGIPEVLLSSAERFDFSEILCGTVAATGIPLIADTAQIEKDPRGTFLRSAGVRAYACHPLMAGDGRVLGTLSFASSRRDRFEPEEIEFLRTLCLFTAMAWERTRAMTALREADRRKNEFLAMLAHELRNPLAPIRNAAQLIRKLGPDEPKLRSAQEIIDRQVIHLARLVDDLLDVSRITQGKVTLRKEPIPLNTVVERAVEAVRPLIESRRHQLAVDISPDPLLIVGDATRLIQVVANLLNNAAKYTEEGGFISLRTEVKGDRALIRIRDTGVGIAPELLPHIFELFTQGERSLDRSQGGLGIGLTLVQRLVELHGGRIEAFSAGQGQGSEFVVDLPLLLAPVSEQTAAAFDSTLR
ncbi:MASE1 domain-containing protein [Methylocaldum sp.]|uniref:sensor histidine kinase n=1 Tax=Methylocaldum sp. TaxID=1969727 RepID=UPI002D37449A|nr:MASE1 domain-containing protein [Methylocaldum sp.]HYE34199.1 MASE1 domain-containing protein [Methylocaldum sp.]